MHDEVHPSTCAVDADPAERAWAAGLFEGEGCFTIRRSGGHEQACAYVSMTDEDVVLRFADFMEVGHVRAEDWFVKNQRGKRQWRWEATAKDDVRYAIDVLFPLLGERRELRALDLLNVLQHKD
jgi:hypothetical protein